MDPHIYDELSKQEKTHWWFISRRAITYTLLSGVTLPKSPMILDVGCGSGGNLPMLKTFGNVFATELHEPALKLSRRRKIGTIEFGMLPGEIPFDDLTFDLVTLFDVLEHVDDDRASLAALAERMNPGAVICLTVPAYQWLFSRLDREHHHFRRYGKRELKERLIEAGLQVQTISHWNCLLLPAAILVRILEKIGTKREYSLGTRIPKPWLNKWLRKIVSAERHIIPHMPLPFGLSLIAIARKI